MKKNYEKLLSSLHLILADYKIVSFILANVYQNLLKFPNYELTLTSLSLSVLCSMAAPSDCLFLSFSFYSPQTVHKITHEPSQ